MISDNMKLTKRKNSPAKNTEGSMRGYRIEKIEKVRDKKREKSLRWENFEGRQVGSFTKTILLVLFGTGAVLSVLRVIGDVLNNDVLSLGSNFVFAIISIFMAYLVVTGILERSYSKLTTAFKVQIVYLVLTMCFALFMVAMEVFALRAAKEEEEKFLLVIYISATVLTFSIPLAIYGYLLAVLNRVRKSYE